MQIPIDRPIIDARNIRAAKEVTISGSGAITHENKAVILITNTGSNTITVDDGVVKGQLLTFRVVSMGGALTIADSGNMSLRGAWLVTAYPEAWLVVVWDGTTWQEISRNDGINNTISGSSAHAEGLSNTASGNYSHAEGQNCTASGIYAHAEGHSAVVAGSTAHGEGEAPVASGDYAHAEGYQCQATASYTSHAEGYQSVASGDGAHAGGFGSTAAGQSAFAHGDTVEAAAVDSVAWGHESKTFRTGETARGYGKFANAGDAQGGHCVMRAAINFDDTDAHKLLIDASGSKHLTIQNDSLMYFEAMIVAKNQATDKCNAWRVYGAIENSDGTTAILTENTEDIHKDDADTDAAAVANDTADSLEFTLTDSSGDAGNMRCVAYVRYVEIAWED